MTGAARDTRRQRFYDTERQILALTDRPGGGAQTVQLAGATLTVPADARFASVESVQRYVDEVLALPSVTSRFPRAAVPVRVRRRRGERAAHYSPTDAEIAVPDGSRWALRELVVLHELAHHLDDSSGPAHGRGFIETLIDLVERVLGPETAFVYRVLVTDAGLM
ncbi:MAG: TIGR04338 family metallohydrolase [Gordonia sp. (in: high G+C Gram-positive bacteria)]|uniref:TIGR04338 family metallohydrolase n=1 Tax=Gordonia sp. (in: high G+C Gram-positive bacteria) TaxID=84139 RepID=UPI0039E30418